MSRYDVRRLAPLTAFALVPALMAPVAAAPSPPYCLQLVVSPSYQQDRTVFCVHRIEDGTQVLGLSRDRGRTWRRAAMSGLVRPAGPSGAALTITISPAYGVDRSLFATSGAGTFVTSDLGQTFAPVDTLTRPGHADNPAAFVGRSELLPVAGTTAPRVLLAYATQFPAVIDPASGTRRPVSGVPGRGAARFAIPASASAPAGALAVVNEPDAAPNSDHARVYRCDAALTCAEPLFAFPAGERFGLDSTLRIHPDGSVVAVLASQGGGATRIWRSTDGGASFSVWQPVERLLPRQVVNEAAPPLVAFATSDAAPRRVFLRVESAMPRTRWTKASPPASQLFRSDDAGRTWRRVGYARTLGQTGPRGTLPWTFGGTTLDLAPDGRLFANGGREGLATTWCSVDGGKRWHAGCPR